MLQKCWWNVQFIQKLNVSYHFCLRERQFLWAKNSTFWVWFKTSKMISIFALPAQGKGAKRFLEVASSVWIYFGIGSVQHLVELHLCWKMNISDRFGGRDSCKLQFSCYLRDLPTSEISWENENIICCNEVFDLRLPPSTVLLFLLTVNQTKEDTSAF